MAILRRLWKPVPEPHPFPIPRVEREPWLVVDPKPIVGDGALDTASLVRVRRDELATAPHPARRIRRRVDFVCG